VNRLHGGMGKESNNEMWSRKQEPLHKFILKRY